MSRRAAALVVGGVVALAAIALLWWSRSGPEPLPTPAGDQPLPQADVESTAAELYFPNTAGRLGVEERQVPYLASAEGRAAQVVRELLAGPTEPGLTTMLGGEVELASLHLSADGVLYVDLAAPQQAMPPVSGSRGELLTVYSLVNSLLTNVPEAAGVVLLWNGHQRPTFAGHVDTTRPLPQDSAWLARR